MAETRRLWEPNEDERRAIRAALVQQRPDLANNEQALQVAEARVVFWVTEKEQEDLETRDAAANKSQARLLRQEG